jgi:MFS family permease
MRKIILMVLIFLYYIGVNLGHPVTPKYIESLQITERAFGYFYSAMSLGLVFGSIVFGILSDKYGKKVFIVIGAVGYALGQYVFANYNSNLLVMIIARFFSGVCAGAPNSLLIIYVINSFSKEKRVLMLTIFNALNILGTSVAYKISGNLNVELLNINQIFWMQIIYMVAYSMLFLTLVKEVNVKANKTNFFKSLKSIGKLPKLIYPLLIFVFLYTFASTNISKYLDVLITNEGHDPKALGDFVFITGLVGIVTNLLLLPIIKKFNKINLLLIFQVISAIVIFIVFSADSKYLLILLYTAYMPYVICKTMVLPIEQNEISEFSKGENDGTILGIRQSFISLANVIGPLLGGFIFEINNRMLFYTSGIITCISILVLVVFNIMLKNQSKKNIEA